MQSSKGKEDRKIQRSTRRSLDGLVVNIELTLVSIIQGVALSVLAESAHTAIGELRFEQWPYIASGLLIILLFWSRSITHTLTLIRWPLEFRHNFLYIACTFVEAIVFTDRIRDRRVVIVHCRCAPDSPTARGSGWIS